MSYLFESSFDDEEDSLFMSFSKFQALYFPESENNMDNNDSVWIPRKIRKKRGKNQFQPADRYKSPFYLKYIKPAEDPDVPLEKNIRNPDSKLGKLFRKRFRVPYSIFETICLDIVEKGIYKPNDGTTRLHFVGRPPVDLEILVLAALRTLSSGVTFDLIEELTNVSSAKHQLFFEDFLKWGRCASGEKINLPRDQAELGHVVNLYDRLGLPGCAGSVDCVHIWWDACPAVFFSLCKGKESYPSLAFEVICSHTKKILSVSPYFWGTNNDKTICRYDPGIQAIRDPHGLLKNYTWESDSNVTGGKEKNVGAYYICDGGYLKWEELIPPYKHQMIDSSPEKWSKHVESMRKDIECVFGILKKRFLILKHPIRFRTPEKIEGIFLTCCVLHNILHEYDGYDNWLENDSVEYDDQEYDGLDLLTLENNVGVPENCTRSELRSWNNNYYSDISDENNEEEDATFFHGSSSEYENFDRRRHNLIQHFEVWTEKRKLHLHLR